MADAAAPRHQSGLCRTPLKRCCCCASLRCGALAAALLYGALAAATVCLSVFGTGHRIATNTVRRLTRGPRPADDRAVAWLAQGAALFLVNVGGRALAHMAGCVGVWRRSRWLSRRYFHFWVLLVVWIPLDTAWYCLTIRHDQSYYNRSYRDGTLMQVEQGFAIAKMAASACGPYFMLIVWSHHENLHRDQSERNEEAGIPWLRPATPVTPIDPDDEDEMALEPTSLEWLAETDPAARRRKKVTF